jgi:NADH-quinone oxidoreductase subunit M
MNYQNLPILSIVTFFPLIGIFIIFFIRKDNYRLIQRIAFITALINFILSVPLYFSFDSSQWKMQFIENIPWIEQFGIYYSMGIDGISLPLVLLTTFLSVIAILSTWTAVTEKVKGYMISLLFLETGMIGVFCALDFILY